jgi:hypothetical protein
VPIASAPAAQAVQVEDDGPRSCSVRATAAQAVFVSASGIRKGLTRSDPRSAYVR